MSPLTWARLVLSHLVLAGLLVLPPVSLAQQRRGEPSKESRITPSGGMQGETPDAVVVEKGQFRWVFHPDRRQAVEGLMDAAPKARGNICSLLPKCGREAIEVRVAETEEQFLDIQPERVHIDWAAGVAWPEKNLIVLRVDQTMMLTLAETFEHELSHLLLYQAIPGEMPRWFVEGLAILQSERNMVQRFEAVAGASVTDALFPLEQLDRGFPNTISGRSLAYAQSGMFVAWLHRTIGPAAFKEVLTAMAHGLPVEEAVRRVTGSTLATWDENWREGLGRGAWLKGLTDSWMLWSVLALLVVVGVYLKRRRNNKRKKLMGGDEGPDWEFHSGTPQ